ncbi:hypothetical protein GF359_02295 [candidate division WOR-3 bacterium]|uniref:Putative zinc-finger domain-containing protein n=1 Tax=candidate division WOR-3 bacterium TaxID=2052148 RepID=A0A9D5K9F4_UNCW3|nr:hypothetical protein [candidate division WOR-3 bacterium]MBD3364024.1 hypothetical protein [candidate division WOR-3 bacterium]
MMKHISKKKLSAWLDGELNEETRQKIKAHLETCEYCRGLASGLKSVSKNLGTLEGLEPSPFFAAQIKGKVLEKRPRRGWRKGLVPALAGTAAALFLVLGGLIGQVMYAGTTDTASETELSGYLGTSPAEDYPEGSFGEIVDDVFGENGGNS